jgi:broad specificity phosphatase PhoE
VALYASPYLRALDTAREIGRCLELEPVVIPEIYEQSFGSMAGRAYLDLYPVLAALSAEERWAARAPGGESLQEVAARVAPAIDRIAERHRGDTVVVVSHGGVMAALRGWVAGAWREPPQSTENAGGYRLVGAPGRGYRGPLPLL